MERISCSAVPARSTSSPGVLVTETEVIVQRDSRFGFLTRSARCIRNAPCRYTASAADPFLGCLFRSAHSPLLTNIPLSSTISRFKGPVQGERPRPYQRSRPRRGIRQKADAYVWCPEMLFSPIQLPLHRVFTPEGMDRAEGGERAADGKAFLRRQAGGPATLEESAGKT